jgi:hypothetical protein
MIISFTHGIKWSYELRMQRDYNYTAMDIYIYICVDTYVYICIYRYEGV